jgi:hypothetical protein
LRDNYTRAAVAKRWRYALIAVAVLGCVIAAAGWFRENVRRMLMLTTADPDALGLVVSDSMQPITLTLESDRIADAPGEAAQPTTLQRISFKVPAAYVNMIDLKEGRGGSQRIGFEVWNRTFDPSAPDVIADRLKCRPGDPCRSEPGTRVARRKEGGEVLLDISIANSAGTQVRRNYNLTTLDWIQRRRPCRVFEDPALGMTVAEAPDGVRPGDACDFSGNPGIRTRDGKSFPPKNFIKRRPDGTPDYLVRCQNFASEPEEQAEISCRLYSYFGIWPVTVMLWGIAPKDWDDVSARVQRFLTEHVAGRTD